MKTKKKKYKTSKLTNKILRSLLKYKIALYKRKITLNQVFKTQKLKQNN